MSDKPPPTPFDQLPRQIQELLRGSNVKAVFSRPEVGGSAGDSEAAEDEINKEHETTLRLIREFNLKPREIRDYLDRFVIQQAEAMHDPASWAAATAAILLGLTGALALACFVKVCGVVFLGLPRSEAARQAHECGWRMRAPMLLLGALCAGIGLAPVLFWPAVACASAVWEPAWLADAPAPAPLLALGAFHLALAALATLAASERFGTGSNATDWRAPGRGIAVMPRPRRACSTLRVRSRGRSRAGSIGFCGRTGIRICPGILSRRRHPTKSTRRRRFWSTSCNRPARA